MQEKDDGVWLDEYFRELLTGESDTGEHLTCSLGYDDAVMAGVVATTFTCDQTTMLKSKDKV